MLILLATLLASAPVLAKPLSLLVETAVVVKDPLTNQDVLNVTFAGEAADKLASFAIRHMEQQIDVRIDGKLITSPWIQSAIPTGVVSLSGDFSTDKLQSMADRLLAGDARVELSRRKQP